ncbi:UNVERIFIED_ORG: transposase [Pseudomonas reinekei]
MKRFIQGEHRGQGTLLPESLDDYVSDTNPVRVVDVFVDEPDLVSLGFDGAIPADRAACLPPSDPAEDLHLRLSQPHPVESTPGTRSPTQRRADVADRAVDARLQDIANLRKDNSKAIRGVCRQFVVLCQQLGLFGENLVAIDGNHHLRAQADDLWSQGSIKAALTCSRSRLMRHAAFALRSFLQERQ